MNHTSRVASAPAERRTAEIAGEVLLVMVNVPVFTASDVPRRCQWMRSRYTSAVRRALDHCGARDVAEEEDRGTGRGRGVVRDRNTPSTPENRRSSSRGVTAADVAETVAPMELLFVQEKFTSDRRCGGSGENVVENLTVVATARHSGGLIWIASLLAKRSRRGSSGRDVAGS